MGLEVKNLFSNPLELSDGKMIAPGDTRKLETVSDRDKDFQKRGWLSIAEIPEQATEAKKEDAALLQSSQKPNGGK